MLKTPEKLCITGINYILEFIQIENSYLNLYKKKITILLFLLYFNQINAASVSIRDFFQKCSKILITSNF